KRQPEGFPPGRQNSFCRRPLCFSGRFNFKTPWQLRELPSAGEAQAQLQPLQRRSLAHYDEKSYG
ncbi:hypothetical protein, partial [uncultured Desulfovibrio sp.]|uniref:hypothetical protein n=1 Tax=uncultured Desulfovibrio sp. TaxID=167968 RepID=UPI0026DD0CB7